MNSIKLNTTDRNPETESVPGVAYGPDLKENLHFEVEYNELNKVLNEAGANKIVQMNVGGEDHEVLFKDVQYNPVTNQIIHFDMYAIKRGQKMKANIPVVLIGESPAVLKGSVLNQFVDEIEVECIPSKLPESFEVDISKLEEVNDDVSIDDLKIEEGVELLVDEHLTIARIEEVQEHKIEDDGPVDAPSEEEGEEGSESVGEEGSGSAGEDSSEEKSE